MSNSSYNFKDNLTIDNNKYLKWLSSTGTSRANIIALNSQNNVNINSAFGDIILNGNGDNSTTFLNTNSNNKNVVIGSKLGIGFDIDSQISANLTLLKNGYIGINTTINSNDGYLGLSGSYLFSNSSGSRISLHGNQNSGKIQLYTGNVNTGDFNFYTGNDSLKMQILSDGSTLFSPDGTSIRLNVSDSQTTITNRVVFTSTEQSNSASSGALQIYGGIGIVGNCYVDGTISLNSATGNINFDSSATSTSYTSGAIFLSGGMGIATTVNASSITSGGALSIAGGVAVGKDVYIGGKTTIVDTTIPSSSQTGSLVLHGGLGMNGPILLRSNVSSQISLAPVSNGSQTSIRFFSTNNFNINDTGNSSSWIIGQNVENVGSGNFSIYNNNSGIILTSTYTGYVGISTSSPSNIFQVGNGAGRLRISNNVSDYTLIGTQDIINSQNTSIKLNGNAINGSIEYKSTNNGSHIWYVTDNTVEKMRLSPNGLFTVNGEVHFTNTSDANNVGDGGSLTVLGGASISKDLYIGGALNINGTIVGGGGGGGSSFAYLTLTSSDEAINYSSGALITVGGIAIQCSTDATSITNGGALSIAGGASISKNLFVGGPALKIPTGNISSRPNNPEGGYIRYNTETQQFEGYGPGSAWGSLGGVIDIAQTTKILASSSPSTTDGNLYFVTTGVERMRINSSGNIGIGTTAPSSQLDIYGNIDNTIGLSISNINNGVNAKAVLNLQNAQIYTMTSDPTFVLRTYSSNTSGIQLLTTNTSASIKMLTNNIERFRITPDGNIGIGTISPNYNLDINGTTRITTSLTSGALYATNSTITNIVATNISSGTIKSTELTTGTINVTTLSVLNNATIVSTTVNNILSTNISSSNALINQLNVSSDSTIGQLFVNGQNIGIGIENPSYKLDVNGAAHIGSDLYVDGVISGGASTSSTFAYLTLTATDESINLTTGALVTFGGITIQCPTDAVNFDNGGSILSEGGMSIAKNAYIGDNMYVRNSIESSKLNITSTENSIGVGTGGSLNVLGGASISKDLYVGWTITSSSDIRLKENIKPFKNNEKMLDKIDNLRTVKYNYKQDYLNTPQVGFIAQDFKEHFPELLRNLDDGYYSLDYQKVTIILMECIKELRNELETLKK
jgi:hypothetical protein